jgi:hypothetical protein
VILEASQVKEISRLRSLNFSPKEIARSLKLRPAEVKEILQQQVMALELERSASGIISPLCKCMVNESGSMLVDHHFPTDSIAPLVPKAITSGASEAIELQGFAQVFIARTHKQQLF